MKCGTHFAVHDGTLNEQNCRAVQSKSADVF